MTPIPPYKKHKAHAPYIIGKVKDCKVSLSNFPHQHKKEEDAVAEALRLSDTTAGRFLVFGAVYCTPPSADLQRERKQRTLFNKVKRRASMCDVLDSLIIGSKE